jgi:hypothetical protein
MTVEAKTYCGFWVKALWVLKTVIAIICVSLMAIVAAGCERVCNADSPGAVVTKDGYECNGAPHECPTAAILRFYLLVRSSTPILSPKATNCI